MGSLFSSRLEEAYPSRILIEQWISKNGSYVQIIWSSSPIGKAPVRPNQTEKGPYES